MNRNRALWIVQGLLAALFLFAGGMKLITPIEVLSVMSPFPGEFIRFIGICEVLGAVGLILPYALRILPGTDRAGGGGPGRDHGRGNGDDAGHRRWRASGADRGAGAAGERRSPRAPAVYIDRRNLAPVSAAGSALVPFALLVATTPPSIDARWRGAVEAG